MEDKQQTEFVPCVPGALPGGLSRTRFFDGMFLTQKDLEREQNYLAMKRRLTNRALGHGVVWGLRFEWDSLRRRFRLGPGYAIDCCGNDLVVECPQEIAERTLVDKSDPVLKALLAGKAAEKKRCREEFVERGPRKACIVLQYVECPEEPRPVHQDACSTNISHCEVSSIRETTRLLLVPPPPPPKPGPVEDLCRTLTAFRKECEEAGVSCELFSSQEHAAETEIPAQVRIYQANSGGVPSAMLTLRPSVTQGLSVKGAVANGAHRFSLEPDPGKVFLGGMVKVAVGTTTSEVKIPPFGVIQEYSQVTTGTPLSVVIEDLVVAPLFGKGTRTKAALTVTTSAIQTGSPLDVVLTTNGITSSPEAAGCADRLGPGLIFNGEDPTCTAKTLVLSTIYGWFAGMLGTEDSEDSSSGRAEVAWWACYVAWRLLFRANLADENGVKLTVLLKKLFEAWCSGFVYPGPRCTENHAGVYLGCVEISPSGNVVSFDPWECRRQVITGPLMAHWAGQFGIAPLDVLVSRLARWICCVGSANIPAAPEMSGKGAEMYYPVNQEGAALYFGEDLESMVGKRGFVVSQSPIAVDPIELGTRLLQVLRPSRGSMDLLTGRKIFSSTELNVHLLVPVRTREGSVPPVPKPNPREPRSGLFDNLTRDLKPLARSTIGDFLSELADAVSLESLKIPADLKPYVDALGESGITSVADYLELGPEAGAGRVRANLSMPGAFEKPEALYAAAETVYTAAENFVAKAAEPVRAAATAVEGPFMRARLGDDKLVMAVRKGAGDALKANALTKASVADAAARVIGRTP